ncbi:pentapeptide repeat-containing protein [Streptosporangium sp. 'caverna']|uniref:pentapeptide repeat-containing protein n=1 Tax=Streptosporangium sp. 'caverna' TaxID=2202249 RepID=UPI000D7D838D|nr:pentapeptide repeat-containing protein [Streptosporangium sp. 'caverna']AWS40203.1 pentapeptide repeat-containing protein [Streptosporangium sp. 'caverna']
MKRFEDHVPPLPGHPVRTDKIAGARPSVLSRVSGPFTLAALLGLAALAGAVFLPRYLLAWDLGTAKPPADYAAAVNNIRTALLQGVGGLVLLIGAYLTWRQLQLSRHGQATESFSSAIAHLGDSSVDVRLGGIYALERISRSSTTDRRVIGEILAAFIGNRARDPQRDIQHACHATTAPDSAINLSLRAPDIHAALTVLGRRDPVRNQVLRLDRMVLPKANLASARLHDVDLHFSDLAEASLVGTDLTRADLTGVRLAGAILVDAVLYQADLRDAVLTRAIAEGVDLRGTDLTKAELRNANLRGARLDYGDLRGATLTGAVLTGASLKHVVFDETTVWPDGFDFSHLRPVRRRSLSPIRPRTYEEFAVQAAIAENDPPAK